MDILQNIILAYYIDDILFIRPEEQEVASVPPLGKTQALPRVGDKNPQKIQRLTRSITFLEVQWSRVCWEISFKIKANLYIALLATKKESQHLVGFVGFQRSISHI